MKTLLKIMLFLSGAGFLIYLGVWGIFVETQKEMDQKSKKEACHFEILSEFEGKIEEIERYEYSKYMNENLFGIKIKISNPNDSFVNFQFDLKKNKKLIEKIYKGQRIKKRKGSSKFQIELKEGIMENFNTPNCNE